MSSFAGVSFRVIPNGGFYPSPIRGEDRITTVSLDVLFLTKTARNDIVTKQSAVTWQPPLGLMVVNGHVDAGYGEGTLIIPSNGGELKTYTSAVLVDIGGGEGYGREQVSEYKASLKFVLLTTPTV